jgi:methoxymalonate biosynthesis acyl carrier protein
MRKEQIESTREEVRHYLLENIESAELDNDEDMFESGLVNSLFAIQLMTFLENKFKIKVTMDDLDMDNFKSVNSIFSFVESKQSGKSYETRYQEDAHTD